MYALKTSLATLALVGLTFGAHATTIQVQPNGQWLEFDVAEDANSDLSWVDNISGPAGYAGDGSVLTFAFTLNTAGSVYVVDAGYAGDSYTLSLNNGTSTQTFVTSAVPVQSFTSADYDTAAPTAGLNFDAAYADHSLYSYAKIDLAPGSYTLTGKLSQSFLLDGAPLNYSVGAIAVVPEPASLALALGGLGVVGAAVRRRAVSAR